MLEITHLESLKVAWLLLWRGSLIGGALGYAIGFLGNVGITLGFPQQSVRIYIGLLAVLVGVFYLCPLLVRMALRKQYKEFRLQLVRNATVQSN